MQVRPSIIVIAVVLFFSLFGVVLWLLGRELLDRYGPPSEPPSQLALTCRDLRIGYLKEQDKWILNYDVRLCIYPLLLEHREYGIVTIQPKKDPIPYDLPTADEFAFDLKGSNGIQPLVIYTKKLGKVPSEIYVEVINSPKMIGDRPSLFVDDFVLNSRE